MRRAGRDELKTITPPGFKLKKGAGAYYWERKTRDVVFWVGVSLRKFSSGLEFQTPTCRVYFPEVQEALTQAIVKFLGAPPPGPDYSIRRPIDKAHHVDGIDYSIFTRSMVTMEDAKAVLKEIERYNTLVSLPRFERLDRRILYTLPAGLRRTPLLTPPLSVLRPSAVVFLFLDL